MRKLARAGNVALEAQYLGLPVIASNSGGLPEIVQDDVTGILVQPNDCGDLSEGIIRLVVKVSDFDRLKTHQATCQKFNKKIFLSQIMNEFESVLQESSQSEPPSADRVVESERRNIARGARCP
jgi:glycosyltransferase involved in cell wall biosynthesis